ncbi:MAG TPA: acetylornithine transaminase [Coleofasciculaceae cyanobacterium]|jgi:acetylornithine/N-succinyldiaminopimelate aminotransferase
MSESSTLKSQTETWIERGQASVMNTYNRFPVALKRGAGCQMWDVDGKRYLDFLSGIAVNSLGHGHEKLVSALNAQMADLMHCSNLYWIPAQIELAELLVKNSPFDKAFFCNSGAEAVESALKLARKYGKTKHNATRTKVIAMTNSFHGRTYGAMTLTGQAKYQADFTPLVPDVIHVPFNDFVALQAAMTPEICAIILEPIQGEGGIQPADPAYLKQVRTLCDAQDIVLIFDEVQTGIGRTGKLFSFQHAGVQPDVIALAKGLGGGFPIGAMLAVDKVAAAFQPGDHASTFGGNPMACTAGKIVLEALLQDGLLSHAAEMGTYLQMRLQELQQQFPAIQNVRGLGLMQGIELNQPVADIVKECLENGLLLVGAGANVIRFVPPLTVGKVEIDEALQILSNLLRRR